jgi:creatinine amidohydrolase
VRRFLGETLNTLFSALRSASGGMQLFSAPKDRPARRGFLLEELSWPEAERALTGETVVVIPLGAQAKEHGHHLPLQNDWLLAEYLKRRVVEASEVVVAPTVNYSFYPAFMEYPGSSTLSRRTACSIFVEICRGWAKHGPRRFYILNTGLSTLVPLRDAAAILAREGVILRFSDEAVFAGVQKAAQWEQPRGSHADELETSMMLFIAPEVVDMGRARPDCAPERPGPLTRFLGRPGTYSPTGAWGDPTRATREKGRAAVEAFLGGLLRQVESLRTEPIGLSPEQVGHQVAVDGLLPLVANGRGD